MRNLIIDGNNILHRTFHANNKGGDPNDVIIGMCIHSALMTINKSFKTFEPDDVIITFDITSWRKEWTRDLSQCVTNKHYKGHRMDDMTPNQKELRRILEEHIVEFADMLNDRTSMIVLRRNLLEGDDLMAAYVQMHPEDEHFVLSGDNDMRQLLRYDGVRVIDPATGDDRTLDDWNGDADLFMFEKRIRGEGKKGDNVQSSYPRLRRDKILKTKDDPYLVENIMNHTFTQLEELPDGTVAEVEYRTGDLFKENGILMDLRKQPDVIKKLMVKTVLEGKENRGRYNHIKFLQYCTRHELDRIRDRIEDFVPLMSVRPKG